MSHAYRLPTAATAAGSECWWLFHGEYDGGLRVARQVADVGLAAALLAELVTDRLVVFIDDGVRAVGRQPPLDVVAHQVWDQVSSEPLLLPVSAWLRFFARTSYELVAGRMLRLRLVSAVEERRLLGRARTVYLPSDPNLAGAPAARLHVALLHWRPMSDADVFLAGLARAAGLRRLLLEGARPGTDAYLDDAVSRLPAVLGELFGWTVAAIGAGVMTRT